MILFKFQHTAARRRLVALFGVESAAFLFQHTAARRRLVLTFYPILLVLKFQHTAARRRLGVAQWCQGRHRCFNTQPPEGGWDSDIKRRLTALVSTHSRPKAAGQLRVHMGAAIRVSTHSRPKAAGFLSFRFKKLFFVSTHSRPKAAGPNCICSVISHWGFQHTAARRRLGVFVRLECGLLMFQHTAARRRLVANFSINSASLYGFNTQPPEGGWV